MRRHHLKWLHGVLALLLPFAPAQAGAQAGFGAQAVWGKDRGHIRFAHRRDDTDAESGAGAFLCGRIAMADGDFDVAALQFLIAFDAEPDNPVIGRQALAANLLAGKPIATTIARRVAHMEPGNPVAQLVLAGIEVQRGNWASAAQHYASMSGEGVFAIIQKPLLAWAQFGAGRKDAMRAWLGPRTEAGAVGGAYLLQEGLMADLSNRPLAAEPLYRAAQADLGAQDFGLARSWASLLARQGRQPEAEKILSAGALSGLDLAFSDTRLRAAIGDRPVADAGDGIAWLYVEFALLARQHDAPQLADMLLRLALDLRPGFSLPRMLAAQALAAEGHAEKALAMLAAVDAADTLAPSAALMRAAILARAGSAAASLALLAGLQTALPDRAEPWLLQGDVLREAHRDAEAISAYSAALSLLGSQDAARARCLYGRGIVEERMGSWPSAEVDFLASLALSPDDPVVLTHLGLAWSNQGKAFPRARKMVGRAAKLRPDDGQIEGSLGEVELRQGDFSAALRTLERAAELLPDDAAINRYLGDAYAAAGRKAEAQFQWARALALSSK